MFTTAGIVCRPLCACTDADPVGRLARVMSRVIDPRRVGGDAGIDALHVAVGLDGAVSSGQLGVEDRLDHVGVEVAVDRSMKKPSMFCGMSRGSIVATRLVELRGVIP
jgi:hypothetical protein